MPDLPNRRRRSVFVAGFALTLLFSITLNAQQVAKPTPVDPASFDFIGISARTTNAAEMSGQGEIPKLWQRLFTENLLNSIPDRADDQIVAVYTDYANGASGEYTYLLGSKVKPGTKPPAGMVAATVPAGKYLEFVTEKGPGAQVVGAAWMQIYGYFQDPAHSQRSYKTDYETYAPPSDPNAVQGHIFIGIQP